MGPAALILAAATASPVCAPAAPLPLLGSPDATLEELYESGRTFDDFLGEATSRKALWDKHYEEGEVPGDLLARANALPGSWRLLAVGEDWCSDSVNTIPFLALLAEAAPGIELRVIDSEKGAGIMESHLTPDGRSATPTVLVLDAEYREAGCWVERPSVLQAWATRNKEELGNEFGPRKMAWYRKDGGRSTLDEVVTVLEAAAERRPSCETG